MSKRYGPIEDIFFLNYKASDIINRFNTTSRNIKRDYIQEFESLVDGN